MSIKDEIRERYAAAARDATAGVSCSGQSCCDDQGCCGDAGPRAFGAGLYDDTLLNGVPQAATLTSLGCGNPTAVAELRTGEVVLDLGSGGGIDVLLSARRVGPTGRAYGVDMTDEMLAPARGHARGAGVAHADLPEGGIQQNPPPAPGGGAG